MKVVRRGSAALIVKSGIVRTGASFLGWHGCDCHFVVCYKVILIIRRERVKIKIGNLLSLIPLVRTGTQRVMNVAKTK